MECTLIMSQIADTANKVTRQKSLSREIPRRIIHMQDVFIFCSTLFARLCDTCHFDPPHLCNARVEERAKYICAGDIGNLR